MKTTSQHGGTSRNWLVIHSKLMYRYCSSYISQSQHKGTHLESRKILRGVKLYTRTYRRNLENAGIIINKTLVECDRFGTVSSNHIVPYSNSRSSIFIALVRCCSTPS